MNRIAILIVVLFSFIGCGGDDHSQAAAPADWGPPVCDNVIPGAYTFTGNLVNGDTSCPASFGPAVTYIGKNGQDNTDTSNCVSYSMRRGCSVDLDQKCPAVHSVGTLTVWNDKMRGRVTMTFSTGDICTYDLQYIKN